MELLHSVHMDNSNERNSMGEVYLYFSSPSILINQHCYWTLSVSAVRVCVCTGAYAFAQVSYE